MLKTSFIAWNMLLLEKPCAKRGLFWFLKVVFPEE
jgi:hypothetical protein